MDYKFSNPEQSVREACDGRPGGARARGGRNAARRAEDASAEAERAVEDAVAWRERAQAAERELGEVKERAWALLEHKEEELRAVRARPGRCCQWPSPRLAFLGDCQEKTSWAR